MINLTISQAKQFILLKHGLIDHHKFIGKDGVLEFIEQAGCIQFDPVDICGRNADLTLQSRIKNFTKNMLDELLYEDRKLFDSYDKCFSIIPIKDWPYFMRYREKSKMRGLSLELLDSSEWQNELQNQLRDYIKENGSICSNDLKFYGQLRWHGGYNGSTNVTKTVLNHLCATGEMIIHHRNGVKKYYDFTANHISDSLLEACDPLPNDFDHLKWRVLRRINAVGLLWNRTSDAWLYIHELWKGSEKTIKRSEIFHALIDEGKIIAISIDGLKDILYCNADDKKLIETILQNKKLIPRCEFIAPLDPLIWDRKIIKKLFDFDYTWEIYSPNHKRVYGAYVLPILLGEQFIGRIEMICNRKNSLLIIKNIWYESGIKPNKKTMDMIDECIKRFAKFNDCEQITSELKA